MTSKSSVLHQTFKSTTSTRAPSSSYASGSSSASSSSASPSFFPLASSQSSRVVHPPTSYWYTSRPSLSATLASLERTLNQSRTHLFKCGLLRSIATPLSSSEFASSLPHPRERRWKDAKEMGVYLRNGTDLRTSEYRRLTGVLAHLEGLLPYAKLADELPPPSTTSPQGINRSVLPPSLVVNPVAANQALASRSQQKDASSDSAEDPSEHQDVDHYRGSATTLSEQLDVLLSRFIAPAVVSATGTTLERVSGAARRLGRMDHHGRVNAVGRRKESTARVWIIPASSASTEASDQAPTPGRILVNSTSLPEYFSVASHRSTVVRPLTLTSSLGVFNVFAIAEGGGIAAQAEAVAMAMARALAEWERCKIEQGELQEGEVTWREILKKANLIDRDPRMVERKKTGQAKARKKFAWVKR
ncbi:BQ2448_1146 [Microbotryum intermedium]|uniref:BQ2448_1146 protein n=1 Tax=Microbotryum intermedium TaxID=269621 RepID=A0A238F7B6_9BASI|nr:BQ2448_1146 [Microbotryum intermedium]